MRPSLKIYSYDFLGFIEETNVIDQYGWSLGIASCDTENLGAGRELQGPCRIDSHIHLVCTLCRSGPGACTYIFTVNPDSSCLQ